MAPRALIRLALALCCLVLLTAPAVARPAEPAKGSVSPSSPKAAWKGQLFLSYYSYTAFNNGTDAECQAPSCDRFTLDVKGTGDLVLKIRQDKKSGEAYVNAGFRVTRPDGKADFRGGGSGPDKDFTWRLKNVTAGEYTLDAVSGWNCCVMPKYEASAELVEPEKVEEDAPPPSPSPSPPSPSPSSEDSASSGPREPGQQPSQTAASPVPPTLLSARVARTSARRFRRVRRLTIALRATGPLTLVRAAITRRSKLVATGHVARLPGDGWVVTRLAKRAKLRPGRYAVLVIGRDNAGRPVIARTTLRVSR